MRATLIDALNRASLTPAQHLDELIKAIPAARVCKDTSDANREAYYALLGAIRSHLIGWYTSNSLFPSSSWAALNPGTAHRWQPDRNRKENARITTHLQWSESFVFAEEQFDRSGDSKYKAQIHLATLPDALVRVDALAATIGDLLVADPAEANETRVDDLLNRFADALGLEAKAWADRYSTGGIEAAQYPNPKHAPGGPVLHIADRINQVSWEVHSLCNRWRSLPNNLLRTRLGKPFHEYLDVIAKHATAGGPQIEVEWPVTVVMDDGSGSHSADNRDELNRMIHRLEFDRRNLRAFFEMQEAREHWTSLIAKAQRPQGNKARSGAPAVPWDRLSSMNEAGNLLKKAFDHIDDRAARLESVAQLLCAVDLPIRARGSDKGEADPSMSLAPVRFITGQLSEFGLCLLNQAYLNADSGSSCLFPMASTSTLACAPRGVAHDFTKSGHPEFSPPSKDVTRAYQIVIAGLDVSLADPVDPTPQSAPDVTPASTGGAANGLQIRSHLSPLVGCELAAIGDAPTIHALQLDFSTVHHIVSLVATGQDFKITPDRLEKIVSQMFSTGGLRLQAIRNYAGVGAMDIEEMLLRFVDISPQAEVRASYASLHEEYCDHVYYLASTQTLLKQGGAKSLIEAIGRSLGSAAVEPLITAGAKFQMEAGACRNPLTITPETGEVPGGHKEPLPVPPPPPKKKAEILQIETVGMVVQVAGTDYFVAATNEKGHPRAMTGTAAESETRNLNPNFARVNDKDLAALHANKRIQKWLTDISKGSSAPYIFCSLGASATGGDVMVGEVMAGTMQKCAPITEPAVDHILLLRRVRPSNNGAPMATSR